MSINFKYWKGSQIDTIGEKNVFVFGSNPEGRHGAGAARAALKFGAIYGQGRGLMGNSYGLVTKNLKYNYFEESTGITYEKTGNQSVSREQIIENIRELYTTARYKSNMNFIITYQDNGGKNLNGYSNYDIWRMFVEAGDVPENIYFHESFSKFYEQDFGVKPDQNLEDTINFDLPQESKEQFTFFFSANDVFSQWHPATFTYKEKTFISCEQFMMFSKAMLFKDYHVGEKLLLISRETLPSKLISKELTSKDILQDHDLYQQWSGIQKRIKALGRQVRDYSDSEWFNKRKSIVYVANREKFTQNKDLLDHLISTSGTTLVEASPYDKIWGIGLSKSDPNAKDRTKWKGKNLLGSILTDLRDTLIADLKVRAKVSNRP